MAIKNCSFWVILKFNVWIVFAIWVNWQLCTLQRDAVGKKNLAPVNHSKPTPGWELHFALKVSVCSSKRTSCQPFTSEWKTYQTIRANSKHLWQHKTTTWQQRRFFFFFLLWAMWATTQGVICVRPPKNKQNTTRFIDHFYVELVEWVLSCIYCDVNLRLRVMDTGCVCVRRGRTDCVQINCISFIKLK